MIETSVEGGSAWLTPLGGINSSLKERERERQKKQLCSSEILHNQSINQLDNKIRLF